MTLMEEKTLADHDINVRSIRQELQLLEEQLKKHGRNEPSQSPTVQPDTDTVSRQAEPNKGGRWEMVSQLGNPPTYVHRCSECHHKVFGLNNFCPNCGADMRP